MTLGIKSLQKYLYYNNRDLVYKCNSESIYQIPALRQSFLLQRKARFEEIYPYISSILLVFDQSPLLIRIKRSLDKKLIGLVIGTKITLNWEDTLMLFLRLKYEGVQEDYLRKLVEAGQHLFFFKMHNFDEILTFYEQYSMLQDFSVKLHFKNCKNKEEEKLVAYTLINI